MTEFLRDTIVGAAPALLTLSVSLLAAWFVGHRLTVRWALRQKRREQALSATEDFYRSYGDFYATWKKWNRYKAQAESERSSERYWEIYGRFCDSVARLEAMIARLATERDQSTMEIKTLGAWRHVYNVLRCAIENDEALHWESSDDAQYLMFKRLAPDVAQIVSGSEFPDTPRRKSPETPLYLITSGAWRTLE